MRQDFNITKFSRDYSWNYDWNSCIFYHICRHSCYLRNPCQTCCWLVYLWLKLWYHQESCVGIRSLY